MRCENVSTTAKNVLSANKGYRYDAVSSGVFEIADIIDFEINELGNTDIQDTIKLIHNITYTNVKEVSQWLYDVLGADKLYGLWLSSKLGVESNYIPPGDYGDGTVYMSSYKIPKNSLIISDLGDQGILLVVDTHPDELILKTDIVSKVYCGHWG